MVNKIKIQSKGISKLWGRNPYTDYPFVQLFDEVYDSPNNYSNSGKDWNATDGYSHKKYLVHDFNHNQLTCVKCGDISTQLEPCGNCGNKKSLEFTGNALSCKIALKGINSKTGYVKNVAALIQLRIHLHTGLNMK